MANKFNNPTIHGSGSGGPKSDTGRPAPTKFVEKVPAFPGVPGKTQPRDRSGGTKKVKGYPRSEGI